MRRRAKIERPAERKWSEKVKDKINQKVERGWTYKRENWSKKERESKVRSGV